MSDPGPRERAEAAFGHVKHAACEMIAAARDTLDLLEQVVTTAGIGEILDGLDHLTQSVFGRTRAPASPPPPGEPRSEQSSVEHIPVR